MAGHVVHLHLSDKGYDVVPAARRAVGGARAVDAEDLGAVRSLLESVNPDVVINCIGVLVRDSQADPVRAIRLNALLPRYLEATGRDLGYSLLHISTDCVFSGRGGPYCENDVPDAEDIYGRSKALGEVNNEHDLTVRTSIIGPELKRNGTGLFHWYMTSRGPVSGFARSLWGGVTTLELAKALADLLEHALVGLIHLTNGTAISKYELLKALAQVWHRDGTLIREAQRPVMDKSMQSVRSDFRYQVPSYLEMCLELRQFMAAHGELYAQYA